MFFSRLQISSQRATQCEDVRVSESVLTHHYAVRSWLLAELWPTFLVLLEEMDPASLPWRWRHELAVSPLPVCGSTIRGAKWLLLAHQYHHANRIFKTWRGPILWTATETNFFLMVELPKQLHRGVGHCSSCSALQIWAELHTAPHAWEGTGPSLFSVLVPSWEVLPLILNHVFSPALIVCSPFYSPPLLKADDSNSSSQVTLFPSQLKKNVQM